MIKKIAVIVAAGSGARMGSAIPKQFLLLRNKPLLWYSIAAFQNAFEDIEIVLVVAPEYFTHAEQIRFSSRNPEKVKIIAGGKTRFESVQNGLENITEKAAIIFVHDGVRCLVTPDLIRRCYEKAVETGNAIPAIAPVDSIRMGTADGNKPVRREMVRMIQTPQTFKSEIIKAAYRQDYQELFTDEASVAEKLGIRINLVEGEPANIKITSPTDLAIAEIILQERNTD
ncbi:MAG: 2-C-methyl-D-erythritol 4-phosphate cytidylyltransferase [Chitinophagales bacterium]